MPVYQYNVFAFFDFQSDTCNPLEVLLEMTMNKMLYIPSNTLALGEITSDL